MRLSVALPLKCERKWKRIAAYMGKDIDALLVEGIDYVWTHFSKDIVQSERQAARYARKIRQAELSVSRLPTKGKGVFVGSFKRRVNGKGFLRLPKCWLDAVDNPCKIYCLCHGKQLTRLFAENEFAQCDDGLKRKAVALSVSPSGYVKFDESVRGFSCANRSVVLRGQIRYIQVELLQDES